MIEVFGVILLNLVPIAPAFAAGWLLRSSIQNRRLARREEEATRSLLVAKEVHEEFMTAYNARQFETYPCLPLLGQPCGHCAKCETGGTS